MAGATKRKVNGMDLSVVLFRSWMVALLLSSVALGAFAGGDSVTVTVVSFGPELPSSIAVEATRGAAAGETETVRVDVEGGSGSVSLTLEDGAFWELRAAAPGFFGPAATITSPLPRQVELELWPAGAVEGKLKTDAPLDVPQRVRLGVMRVPVATTVATEQPEAAHVECQVVEGRLDACVLPAGRWHLRLAAAGLVPQHRFDVTLGRGERLDLGEMVLRRGSSLFGKVVTSDGQPLSRHARVALRPFMNRYLPDSPELQEELERLTESASVNEWGYFELDGLAPRDYQLTAVDAGYMPTTLARVTVAPERQAELAEAVVLRPACRLEVVVSPVADAAGKPWQVRLWDGDPHGARGEAAHGEVKAGVWLSPPLPAGPYQLELLDGDGNRLAREALELRAHRETLALELELVPVAGVVEKGREALEANLAFSASDARVGAATDEDGRFSILLPRPGDWVVAVRNQALDIDLRGLELEIHPEGDDDLVIAVPDTSVRGVVVRASGEPAAEARVTLVRMSDDSPTPPYDDVSDDDGRFELHGVQPGTYRAEAAKGRLRSSLQTLQVTDGVEGPGLQLVLYDVWMLEGKVMSGDDPVPGAAIWGTPLAAHGGYASSMASNARSTLDGAFTLGLPDAAARALLVTMAPGWAFNASVVTRREESGRDEVVIRLAARGGDLEITRPSNPGLVIVNDVPVSLGFLTQWAVLNGRPPLSTESFVAPAMPAGRYVLCDLSHDEALMVMAGLAVPTWDVCSEGFLVEGGVLALAAPPR